MPLRAGGTNDSPRANETGAENTADSIRPSFPTPPRLREPTFQVGSCGAGNALKRGNPPTKETFGNDFREARRKAGVEKSEDGVRKIGATRAANNGATVSRLEPIFGWCGSAMAALHTGAADRRPLANEVITKMEKPPPEKSEPSSVPRCKMREEDERPQDNQGFVR